MRNESDMWDQDSLVGRPTESTFVRRMMNMSVKQAKAVRDDWDEEEEEEEQGKVEQGRDVDGIQAEGATNRVTESGTDSNQVWEEANKRTPMPELIVASASTSQSLPPAALQPTLRILKRPSPNAGAGNGLPVVGSSSPAPRSGEASPGPRGTFAEREAQYQEARSRIFGEKEKQGNAFIVRDPLGPAYELGHDKMHGPAKGFGERRRVNK